MKKIFVFGIGPLPIESSKRFHGGGNRAWHLTKPLLDRGFEVTLLCMRITGSTHPDRPDEACFKEGALTCYTVDELSHFADDDYVRGLIERHRPDALIGACGYPASRAVSVTGDLPVWADVHGYPMGEAQAKAFHYDEGGYIHHFWNIHREVLKRADRFSVTSERQRMALIGELGAMGRLNHHTFRENLVTQIPIAWNEEVPFEKHHRSKDDPFVVFFCGGYNLWCDVELLFEGVEKAMEKDSRIRFLSTGGAITGHDEKSYPRFKTLVENSRFHDRFDLRGWVESAELERCFSQAHIGINVDLNCYETLIGARNRLTEFMARGLPILTTLGTEISQILFYKGMVLTVPMEDSDTLAGEIILAANHPDKLDEMSLKARQLFERQYTYHVTVNELLEWCENPCHSGDYGHPVQLDYREGGRNKERSSENWIRRAVWSLKRRL